MHLRPVGLLVGVLVSASSTGVLLTAAPVSAHTGLVSSAPSAGERVPGPPARVVLEFAAPVSADARSVRVIDGSGAVRSEAVLLSSTRSVVSVLLADDAAAGAWRVRFTVRGDDGHPVTGGFDFGVAAPAVDSGAALPVLPAAVGAAAVLTAALVVLRGWARRSAAVGP